MLDETFRALADPTRRKILAILRDGDRPAGELAAEFPMAWASVSHHLQVLRNAGLVRTRRDGQFIVYSLHTTVFQDALQHLLAIVPGAPEAPSSPTTGVHGAD
ncbi:MAG: autorepressor SdpR family transcription factor [Gemmatimonadota bacterium]